jgi:branched-subunit amino acid transport protein
MNDAWLTVLAVGAVTVVIKAAGPVVLGGRPLPRRVAGIVALLAPALLAALVATTTLGTGQQLTLDARVIGLVAAALALWLRAPVLIVVLVAAAAAAVARLLGVS